MRRLRTALTCNLIIITLMLLGVGNVYGDNATTGSTPKALPLWEFGLTTIAARLPHYIGSDEYENYLYPLPYLIYRGDILKADRDGVRGIFYKGEKFETSLSVWGNPPVSDDNEARQGMPELDAIGEIGPALRYFFYRKDWGDQLYLQAAVRAAFSFGFEGGLDIDTGYEGYHGSVGLKYQNHSMFAAQKLSLFFNTNLKFSDSNYNDYFYGVANQYATASRPQYDADAGYAGFSASSSLFKRLTSKISIGCYIRWNNLDGAVFEDSPLVRDNNNVTVGSLLVWKISESSIPAP